MGLPIQLNHFSQEEVTKLAQCYGLDWEQGEHCQQLMDMVDGHPALVQIALYHLSRGEMTLEHLLKTAPTNAGIYTQHLRRHWLNLKEKPDLLATLHSVLHGVEPVSIKPIFAHKLTSMGLTKQFGEWTVISNKLYQLFFVKEQL